jgi:hypothetical protein
VSEQHGTVNGACLAACMGSLNCKLEAVLHWKALPLGRECCGFSKEASVVKQKKKTRSVISRTAWIFLHRKPISNICSSLRFEHM